MFEGSQFAQPVALFLCQSHRRSKAQEQIVACAYSSGWRPFISPWFGVKSTLSTIWVTNSVEYLERGETRAIQRWERIDPQFLCPLWNMTHSALSDFANLVEGNPEAFVTCCPNPCEVEAWLRAMQRIAVLLQPTADSGMGQTRVASMLVVQPPRLLHHLVSPKLLSDANTSRAQPGNNGSGRLSALPCKIQAMMPQLEEQIRENHGGTHRPLSSREVLFFQSTWSDGGTCSRDAILKDVQCGLPFDSDMNGCLERAVAGWFGDLLKLRNPPPSIVMPYISASGQISQQSLQDELVLDEKMKATLEDTHARCALLARVRKSLPEGETLRLRCAAGRQELPMRIKALHEQAVLEVDIDDPGLAHDVSHPLACYMPVASCDNAYIETAPWPSATFAFLSPRLHGPVSFRSELSREDALLHYLGRRITKDPPQDMLGRRYVEPGSGRTCLVDFLHVAGAPYFKDFSITGVGLTQYSESGFVDIGRAADGNASLSRAEHRHSCGERLAEHGCRIAPVVASITLPKLGVDMPDGSVSPAALIVRAFRCVLRVKQLDPLASFYHNPQYASLVTSYLCDERLWPGEERATRDIAFQLKLQKRAQLLNLFEAVAEDPRDLYKMPENEAKWIRRHAVDSYAPLLIELAKSRLASELGRDGESEPISDDEYLLWFGSTMGAQLAKMRRLRFLHDHHHPGTSRFLENVVYTLVESNVTLLAEFPDLDTGIFVDSDDSCVLDRLQITNDDYHLLASGFERFHLRDLAAARECVGTLAAAASGGDRATVSRTVSAFSASYAKQLETNDLSQSLSK